MIFLNLAMELPMNENFKTWCSALFRVSAIHKYFTKWKDMFL